MHGAGKQFLFFIFLPEKGKLSVLTGSLPLPGEDGVRREALCDRRNRRGPHARHGLRG
jgi:hypothetical protein